MKEMKFFSNRFSKEGPGINKDAPGKKGLALFFEIFFREFWQLLKLNLLFLLFCIPVVTIFPAIGGMTAVTMKMVRDEPSYVWHDFWEGFKKNWKGSLVVGTIGLVSILSIGSSFLIAQTEGISAFFGIGVLINVLAGLFLVNAFPMIVTVDLPLLPAIKNSAIMGIFCLKYSFPALIITEGLLIASVLFFPLSFPLLLAIVFSLISFICSFSAWAGIRRHVVKENLEEAGEKEA